MYINVNGIISMVKMKRAYKYRAYPSKEQQEKLNRQMFLSKQLYNLLLEKSQQHFKDYGKTFTKYDMNKWITSLKRENPELKEVHSQVLQNVADRVSKAYQNFFRRVKERKKGKKIKVGYPRFKSFVSSLTYPQYLQKIEKRRITLSKVGRINFVNHRDIEGRIKACAIKKTKSGEWYITISTEKEDTPPFTNGKSVAGIDLGLADYATISDGTKIPNPNPAKEFKEKSARLQKEISRRKKGGKNRIKSIQKFAHLSEHIARKREDYLHKVSTNLVNSYSFIAYEELKVANMVKNHRFARGIQDASWTQFIQMLCYKAESAGCRVVGVNPRNTSKTCSECGNVQDMPLSQRTFHCQRCGMTMDRDINAAINILKRATEGQSGSHASGDLTNTMGQQQPIASRVGESGTIFGGHLDQ